MIDLDSRSDQPFGDKECGVSLTYNGEVFNYRELKQELEHLGHGFLTQSDTEVLLRAYLAWGEAFLERLDGMFAFGLYDQRSGTALLVRDRVGVKPLYYAELPRAVIFASQPSALLAWPGMNADPDPLGISSFLSYRTVIGERSLFRSIRKLEPGCLARVCKGKVEVDRWWRWQNESQSRRYGTQQIGRLLSKSIEQQLVADVPVATLLSGGIDSSILAYEVAQSAKQKPVCFTGVVRGAAYDESAYAQEAADRFGLEQRFVDIPSPTDLRMVEDLVHRRCHPLGMHNETAMYALAREISKDHKVVMSGEGADELFAGYSRIFRMPFDCARARLLAHLPGSLGSPLSRRWGLPARQVSELDFFLSRYTYFPSSEKLSLATPNWRAAIDEDQPLQSHFAREFAEVGGSLFNRISQVFLSTHLPGLLEMVDNTTMAAGVEARVPYTNHRLVAAAQALPVKWKLRWNSPFAPIDAFFQPISSFSERLDTPKYLLKHLYRNVLPPSILSRRKMGFPLPLGRWAVSDESRNFRKLLFDEEPAVASFLDIGALKRWYESERQAASDTFGKKLWLICNLEIFLRSLSGSAKAEGQRPAGFAAPLSAEP